MDVDKCCMLACRCIREHKLVKAFFTQQKQYLVGFMGFNDVFSQICIGMIIMCFHLSKGEALILEPAHGLLEGEAARDEVVARTSGLHPRTKVGGWRFERKVGRQPLAGSVLHQI